MKDNNLYYKEYYNELMGVLDVVCDQITVADKDGVFLRISQSCVDNFGISKDKIIGHSSYELEKSGIFSTSSTTAVLREKKEVTLFQRTKGGRMLMVTGNPLFDKEGNIYRVINVSHDVTKNEALVKRLQESENMLSIMREQMKERKIKEKDSIIIGTDEASQSTLKVLDAVSNLNVTVLLGGETGVGKSLYARHLHNIGIKSDRPFVQINCGAIPSELIESELFGYVAGSFTGANNKGKIGLIEASKDGTLFLDEISEMPLNLQVKLLHVIQEREYRRIGDTKDRSFKARIVAATNKDLRELVEKGKFREDLYYRLNVVPIDIPPLRERPNDIPILATHFVDQINSKYNLNKEFTKDAITLLKSYHWPGNVRELENIIERILVINTSNKISKEDIQDMFSSLQISIPSTIDLKMGLKDLMEEYEKKIFETIIKKGKTTREMAEDLGIDQSTVVRKLQKFDLN